MRRRSVELPLVASRGTATPLTAQLAGQLRSAVAEGRLAAGERLPASRALAAELGVSRTVVNGAYAQLFAEGWIEARHGSGTYVAQGAPGGGARTPGNETGAGSGRGVPGAAGGTARPAAAGEAGEPLAAEAGELLAYADPAPLIDLRPGIPWTASIDRAAWRRAWRAAGLQSPAATAAYPRGLADLRAALTGYLRRSRGIQCEPANILVTRGVAGGLSLIAAALLRPGDLVGVEEPGYPVARAVFAAHGARLVPCPVDAEGLVVSRLPAGLKLIYTTPSHQYPLGGRLPIPRRRALIGWARANGVLVAEDDYDGEFRYDVAPLPALYGLDPDVVIYLGTTTKTVTPALRVGWLAARPELVTRLGEAADRLGCWPAEPAQRAVLGLLTSGDMERHIRRMRHEYARRRAVLAAAFADFADGADLADGADFADGADGAAGRLLGEEAGMHVVLPTRDDADTIAAAAKARGVGVGTLTRFFAGPVTANGLVIGYGGAPIARLARGCDILRHVLAERPAGLA
jgi:GntR family transcriptional regulator / MocR family aminotransferase